MHCMLGTQRSPVRRRPGHLVDLAHSDARKTPCEATVFSLHLAVAIRLRNTVRGQYMARQYMALHGNGSVLAAQSSGGCPFRPRVQK